MSVETFVFIDSGHLPAAESWQAAITDLDLPMQLDLSVDSTTHTGFWPVTLGQSPSGFEYFAGPVAGWFGRPAPQDAATCDWVVCLVTHGDMRELQAALYAAAGLVSGSGGMYFDEETEGIMELSELLNLGRSVPIAD